MGQDYSEPQPGDLIEIERALHQHWALYLGDGYVINLSHPGIQKVHKMQVFTRMVKKELLEEVVGSDKWCVNNEYDESQKPLPVQEIISQATAYVGQEVTWQFISRNCEHFMKKLRYGDTVSEQAFVDDELHILDKRDDEEYPMPGDLIQISWQLHQHWALYMGDGYVIHVTLKDEGVPSQSGGSRMGAVQMVRRELLGKVAGNDAWAVNNKYDLYWSPRPVEEIIQRAEGCIGKEMAYDVFDFKSDDFVTKLRYGDQWRAFHGGGIHHFDKIDIKCCPIPGDLIEIDRGVFQHWALYMGDGYVIHVVLKGENSPRVSAGTVTFLTRMAKVKKEHLEKVVGNATWRVSNKYDYYWTPLPVKEIIRRAESQIGRIVPYHLFYENCEHFVTELRYGKAYSAQAMTALPIIRSRIADIQARQEGWIRYLHPLGCNADILKTRKGTLEQWCC